MPITGDVQDFFTARVLAAPAFHVFTGQRCEPLVFRPELEDGSAGKVTFRETSFGYWVESGFLAFQHLPRDRLPLRGVTDVSFLAGAGELFFEASSCARLGSRGAPVVLDKGSVNAEAIDASRAPAVHPAFEPIREYLAYAGALYWPVLTHDGVVCRAERLEGPSGKRELAAGQDVHEHEYSQDAMRIQLRPRRGIEFHGESDYRPGVHLMSTPPRALPVHGKDEASFFVEGSRWFFRREDCEAAKSTVRPLELDFVRQLTSHLVSQPKVRGPRVPLPEFVDLNGRFRLARDASPPACEAVSLHRRQSAFLGGPDRGLIVAERPGKVDRYEYAYYWDPRSVWLRQIRATPGRLRGELLPIEATGQGGRDARVGGEIWYAHRKDCERAAAAAR